MTTTRRTLEQGRAEFAYKCAEGAVQQLDDKKAKEYKSYVKKIPMLIKTNGLGATMAFVFSKAKGEEKSAYGLVYRQVEDWLKKDEKQLIPFEKNKIAKALTEVDSATYRAITVEVLAFFTWLRRFAEGLIQGESD